MRYDKQRLLRDADGVPIPQYWDVEESKFKPMGKPAFDGNIELESSEESPIYTQLTGSNVQRVFRPLIFGGDEVIEVTTEGRVESEYVSLSNYKTIDIIIVTEGSAGLELDVNTSFGIGGRRGMSTVYDWVEDDWMVSYFSSGGELSGSGHASIKATSAARRVFILSTHPNFYWLDNYSGHEISLNLLVKNVGEGGGLLRAYVVGDPIV